ncbi:MAG TPA: type II secretion system protein [Epsilonproteobacteria bacterium]|nr:type II secretion system protein [Campylobacterota bacterium]
MDYLPQKESSKNMKYLIPIKRQAFTLIELVFVIIVISILASLALPRLDRDVKLEAGDNILSAIRYTQQLALIDNKVSTSATWQRTLWAIRFTGGANAFYTIATDDNNNSAISKDESAIDPANGKYLYNSSGVFANIAGNESPNIFLGYKYSINAINFAGGCANAQHIAFDHLGRPFNNIGAAGWNYATIMQADCNLTFGFSDNSIGNLTITIEKQTGHAYIVGQPNS